MNKTASIFFIVGTFIQTSFGQTTEVISMNENPKVERSFGTKKPQSFIVDVQLFTVMITEQATSIRIFFTTNFNNVPFIIPSETKISDNNNNVISSIDYFLDAKGVKEFEPNTSYSLNTKGEYAFDLIFDRIPPGIEKFNIDLPFRDRNISWEGVSIKNPDNHPKTNWTELSLKNNWGKNGINSIEGIYESTFVAKNNPIKYRLALKKEGETYQLIYLSGAESTSWKVGDIKAYISETATPSLFKVKWYSFNKAPNENYYISFEKGLLKLTSTIKDDPVPESLYLKLYPTSTNEITSKEGQASGTGFAFSSNGLVVTNYHVIEGAKKINVRGINGHFSKTYNAKVIVTDMNNDLAIIKIDDENYASSEQIPYTFKSSLASTGENVFVLGYPLRSSMGDEIKLTNGIISSKTGYQGDVTSYQISVPIQPGNSGGPLFDSQGNLIGIINAKLVGAENASYAVKVSFLKNLIEILDDKPTLQSINSLNGKTLPQQAEILKKFVYIIEVR